MERNGSGGGGCCIAQYTQTGPNYYSPSPYDLSKMDRIMLRYRPIAPKPVQGSGPTAPQNDDVKSGGRTKRRNSGGNNNGSGSNKRRKSSSSSSTSSSSTSSRSDGDEKRHVERVTLPLLPESPDLVSPRANPSRPMVQKVASPSTAGTGATWLSFEQKQEVVNVSVIVEGVTDTWLDGTTLGRTDSEKRKNLETDTCPAFLSDGWSRVWWTNGAFRRMVAADTAESAAAVRLGMRDTAALPAAVGLSSAFTCRVRVNWGTHNMMTCPCDVWRMEGGGFAWRLDLNAALSLGR